jgi:hypothetical protein
LVGRPDWKPGWKLGWATRVYSIKSDGLLLFPFAKCELVSFVFGEGSNDKPEMETTIRDRPGDEFQPHGNGGCLQLAQVWEVLCGISSFLACVK